MTDPCPSVQSVVQNPPVTKHQAFRDLALTECPCGGHKARMMSHCRACYFALPRPMRQALYNTHDDYVAPYNESLKFLGHESPSAREDRLRSEAVAAGVQAVITSTLSTTSTQSTTP